MRDPASSKFDQLLKKINHGFSLIELIVVIAIISILAIIGLTIFTGAQKGARDTKRKADINALASTYEKNFDLNEDSYLPLADGDFADGQVPAPPGGGKYNGLITSAASGYRVCAALEDHPPATPCNATSDTCYCRSSGDGYAGGGGPTVAPTSSPPIFAAKQDYSTGLYSYMAEVGDIDGDGKNDVVIVNAGGGTVSVLYNQGGGVLGNKRDFATGTEPYGVVIGDLNGVTLPDLAVSRNHDLSILTNNGSGIFGPPTAYPTSKNNGSLIAKGDLDKDGDLDVAMTSFGSFDVSVFTNNGNGTFSPPVHYATGTNPFGIVIGKLNNDDYPDLAVTNYNTGADGTIGSISIFINKGDGTFNSTANYTYDTGRGPMGLAIGDLDGDTDNDLAVANEFNGMVSVFTNNGNGTFQAKRDYSGGKGIVAIGNLNNDTSPDIAATDINTNTVSVLINKGDGTFLDKVDLTTGIEPYSVTIGDVNGDGRGDLVVVNENYSGGGNSSISVFLQQ